MKGSSRRVGQGGRGAEDGVRRGHALEGEVHDAEDGGTGKGAGGELGRDGLGEEDAGRGRERRKMVGRWRRGRPR